MDISSTSSATSATASGSSASGKTIAGNFDQFLMLLTTQLKNQSPLDPLDTNQFTQQLVQFASVEQQLKSNQTLNALLTSSQASTALAAAGFVGKQVSADGSTATLANGKAAWTVNAPRDATQATFTIKDKSGSAVSSQTRALPAGAQSFAWDGRTSTGLTAPDGDYTLTVTARDAAGQTVPVAMEVVGRVDAVDMSGDAPVLVIGSSRVPLSKVKSITQLPTG